MPRLIDLPEFVWPTPLSPPGLTYTGFFAPCPPPNLGAYFNALRFATLPSTLIVNPLAKAGFLLLLSSSTIEILLSLFVEDDMERPNKFYRSFLDILLRSADLPGSSYVKSRSSADSIL